MCVCVAAVKCAAGKATRRHNWHWEAAAGGRVTRVCEARDMTWKKWSLWGRKDDFSGRYEGYYHMGTRDTPPPRSASKMKAVLLPTSVDGMSPHVYTGHYCQPVRTCQPVLTKFRLTDLLTDFGRTDCTPAALQLRFLFALSLS